MKKFLGLGWIAIASGLSLGGLNSAQAQSETPMPSAKRSEEKASCLMLNFRGAPLEMVLDYMSEAAGFTILLETQIKGTVDVWSDQAVNREEALRLLNASLVNNGYAAVREGKTLRIVNRDEAKTRSIPVKLGGDPDAIPSTAEIATQIIPVRFTEASRMIKDLQPLVSTRATMTANESANTIVVTDTQTSIRRAAKLIQAIDSGAEDFTVVKVFHLRHADPTETAELLSELFPSQSKSENTSSPIQFGTGQPGIGGFGGGPSGPAGGNSFETSTGGTQGRQNMRRTRQVGVTAVADARTASLVVRTSRSLMEQVERVVEKLDESQAGTQKVAVLHLKNARAQQVANVLEDLFQKSGTTARTGSNQTDPLETRSNTQTQTQSQQSGANSRTGLGGSSGGLGSGLGGGNAGAPQ